MSKPKPWEIVRPLRIGVKPSKAPEYQKAYHAARRSKLIAEHRCTRCKEDLPVDYTKRNCAACLAVHSVKSKTGRSSGGQPKYA